MVVNPARTEASLAFIGLAGRDPEWSDARGLIAFAGRAGFRGVRPDATVPGLRPRELDRSARRDLAAHLRRAEVVFTGVDLFIPPEHFADPARVDRAADAVHAAVRFVDEVDRLCGGGGQRVVALAFPADVPGGVVAPLAEEAHRAGVVIADHASTPRDARPGLGAGVEVGPIAGVGGLGAGLRSGANAPASVRIPAHAWFEAGPAATNDEGLIAGLLATGFAGLPVLDLRRCIAPSAAVDRARRALSGGLIR